MDKILIIMMMNDDDDNLTLSLHKRYGLFQFVLNNLE